MGETDRCVFCEVMFLGPAATACADVGDVDRAKEYVATAHEAAKRWDGNAWQAGVLEARAYILSVEWRVEDAEDVLAGGGGAVPGGRPADGRGALSGAWRYVCRTGRRVVTPGAHTTVTRRGGAMTTTPNEPVSDEDIETLNAGVSAPQPGGDADGTDGDSTDVQDGDASDGDSTDTTDGDASDGGDADGTDGDSTDTTDGDASDGDSTDASDGDASDGGDADGTDA